MLCESLQLPGVPFGINYSSDHVSGRQASYSFRLRVSGPTVPASLKRIEVHIEIAGQRQTAICLPAPNLFHSFRWDGLDAYGR